MITIFINGLSGKMGKTINNLILDDPDFEIVKTVSESDVVIDFSRPESTTTAVTPWPVTPCLYAPITLISSPGISILASCLVDLASYCFARFSWS